MVPIVAIVALFVFIFKFNYRDLGTTTTPVPVSNSPTTEVAENHTSVSKNVYLMAKEGAEWSEIAKFEGLTSKTIAKYKNLLFYADKVGAEVMIYSLRLDTGIKDKFFTIENDHLYINDIRIIGNEIYFSTGGYMAIGGLYWAPLEPLGKPKLLADARNSKITNFAGHDWLLSGEGDGCGGFTDYNLLDFKTKKITKIATSKSGCAEGDEMIDIDKNERMILAYHKNTSENEYGDLRYTSVVAVSINNPQLKEGVIDLATMPKNVKSIKYIESSNSLALKGDKLSIYNLDSKQFTKEIELPNEMGNTAIDSIDDKFACLFDMGDGDGHGTFQIDLVAGKVSDGTDKCKFWQNDITEVIDLNVNPEENILKMNKLLDLPEKYKLEYR